MNAPNTVLILRGEPYQLRWDKGAMFRADELGVFGKSKPGIGLAKAAKYVCAMLPKEGREKYPEPQDVAAVLPPLAEVWPIVNSAIEAAGETCDPKNVIGSTNGRSPSSS